ncbi:hypothetical protein AVEN_220139-1 [Araneus ventricosus]|uniref:Uncharacterized protein n=1 Tax=Araneus ventricosus TaxID=182803 RepID=A0A4Y2U833_ARAVE|nr:hypothetical protein AVEN_220139-1 [Araneus ventricosus]
MKTDTRSEVDASSCKDMDTTRMADDPEQATTPPGEEKTEYVEIQMVSSHKANRDIHLEKKLSPAKTTNMFHHLAEEKIQNTATKSVPEINLKIISNCNRILKEITHQFPKTENRLRRDFMGMKENTEENYHLPQRENLEFVLSEA